jgi:cytochrome c
VWDDASLDAWLSDPQHVVPGNTMTFAGVKDPRQRADLIAYLKEATQKGRAPLRQHARRQGGMMGMMGSGEVPNLKKLSPDQQVRSITHCADTYTVSTGDGRIRAIWERNLRIKTDSSDDGPVKGTPAIIGAGMMGDRFDVIFAAPDEISASIVEQC